MNDKMKNKKFVDKDGKEIDVTNAYMTKDPVVILIYLLMVKAVPIGMIVAIINEIKKGKNSDYVIQEKELGEYAKRLSEELY